MRKLILLALPCVMAMVSGCGGSGYSDGTAYETNSSGYAESAPQGSTKYGDSQIYNTSVRDSAPFGNYPINRNAPPIPCPNCQVPR